MIKGSETCSNENFLHSLHEAFPGSERWLYPQSEYDYNKANVDAAAQRQYSGNDDVNGIMWLLQ